MKIIFINGVMNRRTAYRSQRYSTIEKRWFYNLPETIEEKRWQCGQFPNKPILRTYEYKRGITVNIGIPVTYYRYGCPDKDNLQRQYNALNPAAQLNSLNQRLAARSSLQQAYQRMPFGILGLG